MRRRRHGGFTDGSVQLALIDQPAAARRRRYRHIHTAEDLGRDDDHRSAVAPGVGGSEGLLRNAEDEQEQLVARLLGPVVAAPNAP